MITSLVPQVLKHGGEWAVTAAYHCQNRLSQMGLDQMVSQSRNIIFLAISFLFLINYFFPSDGSLSAPILDFKSVTD